MAVAVAVVGAVGGAVGVWLLCVVNSLELCEVSVNSS